jgi:DnaK suppressor protein
MGTKIKTIKTSMATRKSMLEAMLEAARKELLRACGEREEILIETLADPSDRMKSRTDRDVAVQVLDRESRLIHDIERAIVKLEKDSYGSCEGCDQPISSKRLDALPWARLCFACQSNAEAAEHLAAPHFARAA